MNWHEARQHLAECKRLRGLKDWHAKYEHAHLIPTAATYLFGRLNQRESQLRALLDASKALLESRDDAREAQLREIIRQVELVPPPDAEIVE